MLPSCSRLVKTSHLSVVPSRRLTELACEALKSSFCRGSIEIRGSSHCYLNGRALSSSEIDRRCCSGEYGPGPNGGCRQVVEVSLRSCLPWDLLTPPVPLVLWDKTCPLDVCLLQSVCVARAEFTIGFCGLITWGCLSEKLIAQGLSISHFYGLLVSNTFGSVHLIVKLVGSTG